MRFVKAILVLALTLPGWAQTVTIVQPDVAGLELIGWQSPEFQASLDAALGPQVIGQLGAWVPYTVVLKNNSAEALAAYQMQWSANGTTAGTGLGSASPGPNFILKPGDALVFLPGLEVATHMAVDLPTRLLQRNMTMQLASLGKMKAVVISLDSVVFASGRFVGPDKQENFARDVAQFAAGRTVDVELQSKLAAGDSYDSIASWLSEIANQPIAGGPRATRDWNTEFQITEARHLLRRLQGSGAPAVLKLVQQQLQAPAITVHR